MQISNPPTAQTTSVKVLEIILADSTKLFDTLEISIQYIKILNQYQYIWLADLRYQIYQAVIDQVNKSEPTENCISKLTEFF